ncbi:MAG: DUF1489 family protein [Alphaproteobacteria bacterium]
MTLHLIKLCVGVDSISQLRHWQRRRLADLESAGEEAQLRHVTRHMPRRSDEILGTGSLYWVIRGVIQVRQPITELRRVTGHDGIKRCAIMLGPNLVATLPVPRRPFQGWRYLPAKEAPRDLAETSTKDLPPELRVELAELGLL